MAQAVTQSITDYFTYPDIGAEDWRYAFATAEVRALEIAMLSRAILLDMANSDNFDQAADLLSGTEYALPGPKNFVEVEPALHHRRTDVREFFAAMMLDEAIVGIFKARDDYANLRLALRRTLTDRPIGRDYSDQGAVSPDIFEEVFEAENYQLFPPYMQQAVDAAVLAYYQKKDVRQIDYAIDAAQADHNLATARDLNSAFLTGLFRMHIDLTNIRTTFRLKLTESDDRKVFLEGGFLETDRFRHALDLGYEAMVPLFFVTPYHRLIEAGAAYMTSNKSFLKLEQQCEEHLTGFLKSTVQITAGPQPIIAYLLLKENEIRTVRLILTAKKNALDTKLILDRIS